MTFKGQNPHVRDGEPGGRLAERTLALVNIPSVSRAEAEAMAYVRSELPLEPVWSSDGKHLYYRDGQQFVDATYTA